MLPASLTRILDQLGDDDVVLDIGAWGAVAVGFFLNTGAYYGEILRAGLDPVWIDALTHFGWRTLLPENERVEFMADPDQDRPDA